METKSNSIFKLVEDTPEQVIVKINVKTSLDVAKHPYINANMDYITVTKGRSRTFTIIYKDGTTMSFDEGESGLTLVDDSLKRLKRELKQFFKDNKISIC